MRICSKLLRRHSGCEVIQSAVSVLNAGLDVSGKADVNPCCLTSGWSLRRAREGLLLGVVWDVGVVLTRLSYSVVDMRIVLIPVLWKVRHRLNPTRTSKQHDSYYGWLDNGMICDLPLMHVEAADIGNLGNLKIK